MLRTRIKDYRSENRLFAVRAIQAIAFVLILLIILISRLVFLQVYEYDTYATLSKENRVKLVAVAPTRGIIFDRNGKVLAESQPSYSLEITPERVKDLEAAINEIAQIIPIDKLDRSRFYKIKKRRPAFEGIPLRLNMTDEEVARVAVEQHRLPGVDIVARLVRHYPQKEHAVHAIGYVGRISEQELETVDQSNYRSTNHIGKLGIEKHYEHLLHGSVGVQQVEINARGRILKKLESVAAQPGRNLHMTIDSNLQRIAEEALGEENGAVVAIEPETGDVLVFASQPGYDPNLFVNGIDHKTYNAYNTSENKPLNNRALYGRYPPGSTIKPFVALTGLETNVIQHDHNTSCPGYFRLPGDTHKYRCWKQHGHGPVDLNKSIVQSCDVFYYELARMIKIDPLHDYMKLFGFGVKTGVDLLETRHEPSGLFPSSAWKRRVKKQPWYPGETLITGIGQGFTLVTPLQLAVATATMANRGKLIKPRLVREIENIRSGEKQQIAPILVNKINIVENDHWLQVIGAMKDVIHTPRGTARRLNKDIPYTIAGKTGTAQVIGIKQNEKYDESKVLKKHQDHALFIAFAPVENPKIAVAVIVENGGHGGATAAPVAGKIIRSWLMPKIESGEIQLPTEEVEEEPDNE
ncbi:MAG: penicillin-binding protein 2 [Gammaproteobacteria bacterium]|nr:penicillin-binding protein 2 [Gammaproteobacteria bacterium]